MKNHCLLAAAAAALALAACEVTVKDPETGNQQGGAASQAAPAPQDPLAQQRARIRADAQRQLLNLRFVVDISERQLQVLDGDRVAATHEAAVGSKEWPTPTGSFAFHRVDINPEWIPPKDEEWAEDEEAKKPGDPENPMGRARLVYRMPNTVHGTSDTESLGTATSHGSIRVANEVALQLAQLLLKAGGAWEGDPWFNQMVQNRTREFQIPLERKIPIEVRD